MTPTKAENAITKATSAGDGEARIFNRGQTDKPQFRITPTEGGYFMEEAVAAGRWWLPRAYMLTADAIGADDIPAHAWAEREQYAHDQAEAAAVLDEHKLSLATPIADYADDEDAELRDAARTLRGLRWLLVWPADAVAEHIDAYHRQWAEDASA